MSTRVTSTALAAAAALLTSGALRAADPVDLVGLTDDGALVLFRSDRPGDARRVAVSGVRGTLVGLDLRPADGRLYAQSDTNNLYVVEPGTGRAKRVCTLTVAFDGGQRSGFDFNPQSDRLRLVSASGQNLRAHPATGATASDAPIAYAPHDPGFGQRPHVTAAAYSNSLPAAVATKLFEIDSERDVLVLQDPPNDGLLRTVGPLGADFSAAAGFDILTLTPGRESAFAVSGATLYTVDLASGRATELGAVGSGDLRLVSLAALPPAR